MSKIKHFIEQSWLLIAASFLFGLLIAITNAAWAPRIEQNKIDKLNRLMVSLLPQAGSFVSQGEVEIDSAKGKKLKSTIYKAVTDTNECVGWAFNTIGSGFADKIELVIAVDKDFKTFSGFEVLKSNETPGFGDKIKRPYYRDQFAGAPAESLNVSKTGDSEIIDSQIIAITGATVSSEAVVNIVNNATKQIKEQMVQKGSITNGK